MKVGVVFSKLSQGVLYCKLATFSSTVSFLFQVSGTVRAEKQFIDNRYEQVNSMFIVSYLINN